MPNAISPGKDHIFKIKKNTTNNITPLMSCVLGSSNTLFCLICVGYRLDLCAAIKFCSHCSFYQLRYIIFFGVHMNYLCYLGKK